MNRSRFNSAC